ncbi:MAG: molecular chaperone TorD family protein [Nitrospirae bacterium]|nr:molecular chaperone TorD family protein [Nitrospirota bacterium]
MTLDFPEIFNLLSTMYLCKPTKEALENWKVLLSGDVPDFMADLKNSIDNIDLNSEQTLEDLLWEYTRLFIGPYRLPCPPWESVYTSSRKLMMQDAYDEVLNFYNEAGLAVNNPDIMSDHIGAELNFLAVLFQRIDSEPEKMFYCTNIAIRFLDEHIIKWVPTFTRDMEDAADSFFYRALAMSTRNFIHKLH